MSFREHIDVYLVEIEQIALADLALCIEMLTAAERAAMDRFLSPAAKRQFIIGRALARWLLAGRWAMPVEQVAFHYSAYGKPHAIAPDGAPPCHFNLSHCATTVAFAMTDRFDVGIDVEHIDRHLDIAALADYCLSAEEKRWLDRQTERERAFFRCWTLKEACVKALGTGMTTDFQSVECRFTKQGKPFAFRYPLPAGERMRCMSAWQFQISAAETISVVAAHDREETAFSLRVLKLLPGFQVLPVVASLEYGFGSGEGMDAKISGHCET